MLYGADTNYQKKALKRAKPGSLHPASFILHHPLHLILLSPFEVGSVMGLPSQMSYQDKPLLCCKFLALPDRRFVSSLIVS